MIVNVFLNTIFSFIDLLLRPLELISVDNIDFISSMPILANFMSIIVYVLPWNNLVPLISLICTLICIRIIIALIKFIKGFIPAMGG